METVLLLFLLMNLGKNGEWKNSLEEFLKFYRENREMIALAVNAMGLKQPGTAPAAPAANFSANPAAQQEKSRPPEENGNLNVLEEFLKARAV